MNNIMHANHMTQGQMMEWIMCLGFCADDMKLYLDTHCDDTEALDYYNQCKDVLKSAQKTYEDMYGPLIMECSGKIDQWNWNTTPMPWEGVC